MLTLSSILVLSTISVSSIVSAGETMSLQAMEEKWHIYVIDEGFGTIAVDTQGLPHIAYHTISDRIFKYASWENGNWSLRDIDSRYGAGHTSSLAMDGQDRLIAAHWNYGSHPNATAIMLARQVASNWTFEEVVNETNTHFSLALNSSDLPRISYMRWTPSVTRQLWIAVLNSNGTWTHTMIDSEGDLRYSSLSVDLENNYHISYEELGAELRYAFWNGSSWTLEKVDTNGSVGAWSSIRTYEDGNPHISYYNGTNSKLKYATKKSGKWNITSIDYMYGPMTSLDLDTLERPHISYQGIDLHLRHAWWNGTAWQIEIVDTNSTDVGTFSTIRIDKYDDIHISYMDEERRLVKYATTKDLPAAGIETTIDIDPDTLDLKSKGRFITAYIELEGADVRDIDASSILLNDAISPVLDEKYGFVTSEDSYIVDHDENGVPERMVKFWRSEVQNILDIGLSVTITVSGQLFDGTPFSGTDEIRVIDTDSLVRPKVFDTSYVTPLAVSPKTHGFKNVPILVHFTSLLDADNDPQQWISSQIAEPVSSSIPKMNDRLQFWYRT